MQVIVSYCMSIPLVSKIIKYVDLEREFFGLGLSYVFGLPHA